MTENINLITAVLGLFSAVAAIYTIKKENMKKQKTDEKDDVIKGIFIMFLILGFYFFYIIGFSLLPKIMDWDSSSQKKDEKTLLLKNIKVPTNENLRLIYIATNIESYSKKNEQLKKLYNYFNSNKQYKYSLKCIEAIDSYSLKNKLSIDLFNQSLINNEIDIAIKSILLNESYSEKNKYLEALLNRLIRSNTTKAEKSNIN